MSKPLSDKAKEEIFDAYAKYSVLSFPGRTSPRAQVEVARMFGTPMSLKFRLYDEKNHPLVGLIEQDGSEDFIVGEAWHSDNMDYETLYSSLVMYQEVSPGVGGDTCFPACIPPTTRFRSPCRSSWKARRR